MNTEKYHTLLPMFDELQGERVVVRPYRESDAQALVDAVSESREHIRPWLSFADAHQSVEEKGRLRNDRVDAFGNLRDMLVFSLISDDKQPS